MGLQGGKNSKSVFIRKEKKYHVYETHVTSVMHFKELLNSGITFYIDFLIKMLNNYGQMKVGGINPQLVDLITGMFL